MKPHLKTVATETIVERDVDSETGEVLDENVIIKERKILVHSEKEFVQVFLSMNGVIDNLSGSEKTVLYYLIFGCDRENKIALIKPVKEDFAKRGGIKATTFSNCVTTLVDKKILIRLGSSLYRLHPRYVWKSTSGEREKLLRYILEYECPDC